MSHTVCQDCKGWIFGKNHTCVVRHDCSKDGHVDKGLIASFKCKYCDYNESYNN